MPADTTENIPVIDITDDGFVVREIIEDLDRAELQAKTGAGLRFADDCIVLNPPAI